jgi:hypothetical protein
MASDEVLSRRTSIEAGTSRNESKELRLVASTSHVTAESGSREGERVERVDERVRETDERVSGTVGRVVKIEIDESDKQKKRDNEIERVESRNRVEREIDEKSVSREGLVDGSSVAESSSEWLERAVRLGTAQFEE